MASLEHSYEITGRFKILESVTPSTSHIIINFPWMWVWAECKQGLSLPWSSEQRDNYAAPCEPANLLFGRADQGMLRVWEMRDPNATKG